MTRTSVGDILTTINHLVYRSTSVHQFATFFLARIQDDCLKLTYSNAGHNYPVLYRRGGERVTLEQGGTVVGILEAVRFEEGSVDLAAATASSSTPTASARPRTRPASSSAKSACTRRWRSWARARTPTRSSITCSHACTRSWTASSPATT
jgi:hypothetical protein